MGPDGPGPSSGAGANWFGGTASAVLQGRDIHGGVHFHVGERPALLPSQVPPPPAHFTNYERPLQDLDEWLLADTDTAGADGGPRVAVIRGATGSGTTSLACHWVHRHRDRCPDGRFFVRLAGGPDGAEQERPALEGLLRGVGFTPDDVPASLEGRSQRWRSWSEGRRIALVVDDALTAGQVRALLPGAGPAAVLVTEAGPLTSLRAWATLRTVDLSPMGADAARDLLARLAGEGRIDVEPDAVAELIDVCEGSTVALCVAGSLLADRPDRPARPDRADGPVTRLVGRLRDDGRTLRELSSDADLSVEVVLDAAYRRLPPAARHCNRVLGAHPGPGDVSVDAVAVALGVDRHDAGDALDRLTRARLVDEADEGRYRTSGLVRRHARVRAEDDRTAGREEMERHLVAYYWARALAAEQRRSAANGGSTSNSRVAAVTVWAMARTVRGPVGRVALEGPRRTIRSGCRRGCHAPARRGRRRFPRPG